MSDMTAHELADLIDHHSSALVLFARQRCDTPEDVVQDAFCALSALRTAPDDPAAWLFRTVRNRSLDVGKAERRRRRREVSVGAAVPWFVEPRANGLEATEAVAALQSLPDEWREVIVLRLWSELTLDQIAAAVGCSVSTAHRRYEAGIAVLRQKLGESCPTT
ncbi:MAG: sigma-70 family RNA polymerase sigma factor [Fimbriiglobus sp.]|jgi:RNA polymerase sigma-70 factor (ECF subfamily)|nr:sigma-70 family RNA polymerase sigma factor [Fimbriiglobus sp.]